jgi:hypothetical protein
MKQPRTSDFDPSAQERQLTSSMADFPAIERPEQIQQTDRLPNPARPGRGDRVAPDAPTRKREIKSRHSFDVYEDQVEKLQQLALDDRMRGGVGSMSAMVREAIDDYLAKVRQLPGA